MTRLVRVAEIASCLAALAAARFAFAVPLDADETIRLGVRTYVNARIGTQRTDKLVTVSDTEPVVTTFDSQTFPYSPAGHLRQNRMFIEAQLDHDLGELMKKDFGPLSLLKDLPFKVTGLKYTLTYRGEFEGIYDWGPSEYSTSNSYRQLLENAAGEFNPPFTCTLQACPNIPLARHNLHHLGGHRNRLFQAFFDIEFGELFIRAGRQILVWGETDVFRVIDNINPVDSSFGGFLIDLDERRVPLDMIRLNYGLGSLGPLDEVFLEGYAAWDKSVSYYPGQLPGSAWAYPNLGQPNGVPPGSTQDYIIRPPLSFAGTRGGARLVFNTLGATWSVAHYYTYADQPLAQTCVGPRFPVQKISTVPGGSGQIPGCPIAATAQPITQPAGQPPGTFILLAPTAYAVLLPAKIQVSGLSGSYAIPAEVTGRAGLTGELIVRSELAYIKDEPIAAQTQLDPFTYLIASPNPVQTGGTLHADSINYVLGFDTNQFIHFLNPLNSFFISTQFFYKHIKKAPPDMVLPIPAEYVPSQIPDLGAIRPVFVHNYANQYVQTLLVSTSYLGGKVNPSFTLLYDWSGAVAVIPSVTLVHDPFRFTVQLNTIVAGSLKGNSGVSLLKDRDNVLFQLEYVI